MARRILAGTLFAVVASCGGGGGSGNGNSNGDGAGTLGIINRAPQIAPIPDTTNSPNSFATRVRPSVSDPDSDSLDLTVAVTDDRVVKASFDPVVGEIVLEPLGSGSSEVTVTVSDGELTATQNFAFEVGEVTKVVDVSADIEGGAAVSLLNTSDQSVEFALTHNGFRTFQDIDEIVEYVRNMPGETGGEAFPRKLWRFVRDSVYHWPFLSPSPWLMNPLVEINSLGWGFCTSVSATYVELARAAGYEARVWALGGHVVPEVRTEAGWAVFDPDLAVFYLAPSGAVAGISELAADPSLVSAPLDPLFGAGEYATPYLSVIADIYGTQSDNAIWPIPMPTPAGQSGRIVLPPGARLTYQGKWTDPPVGVDDNGQTYEVPEFRQAALTLASGWTGTIALPWVAWDVQGDGQVEIDGARFSIGSEVLRQRLHNANGPIHEMQIVASGNETRIVFLINPKRYEVLAQNLVELTGRDVWQVQVGTEQLPVAVRPGPPFAFALRKPVPLNLSN